MKRYNIGILGATGAIGQEMINVLLERKFPINNLRLFASSRSVGKEFKFNNTSILIEETKEDNKLYEGLEIVLCALENDLAKKIIPNVIKAGAIVIDNSSAYRLNGDVPLIIPEINPDDIFKHNGIIANPNCATIIGLIAVNELNKHNKIKRLIISTYQAVSGAGSGGIVELNEQIKALSDNVKIICNIFPYQIAYNLIPQIGSFNDLGYSSEEMKFQNEGRKILHNQDLMVNCTCVRVPVYRSHSESITIEFENDIEPNEVKQLLSKADGVKLVDDLENKKYPMPLDSSDQDLVFVGRIRRDISRNDKKGIVLWCCGDQIRKGAATNAVQIAEILVK